jgi:uncharacterized protein YjiS (DUF1127 family)
MHASDEFYFLRFEHRPLTPEQLDQLKRSAGRGAREHRARLVRRLGSAALASLRGAGGGAGRIVRVFVDRAAAVAGERWQAYAAWRERRAAVKELAALDDRTLRDLGLTRSEIEFVVGRQDAARPSERQAPARQCAAPAGTAASRRPRAVDREARGVSRPLSRCMTLFDAVC